MHTNLPIGLVAVLCAVLLLRAEMRRRRLLTARLWHASLLTVLDVCSSAIVLGLGIASLLAFFSTLSMTAAAALAEAIASLAIS
jgi:hypothetical protein